MSHIWPCPGPWVDIMVGIMADLWWNGGSINHSSATGLTPLTSGQIRPKKKLFVSCNPTVTSFYKKKKPTRKKNMHKTCIKHTFFTKKIIGKKITDLPSLYFFGPLQETQQLLFLGLMEIETSTPFLPWASGTYIHYIVCQRLKACMLKHFCALLTLILLTTTIVVVCSSALRFHSRIRVKSTK